MKLYRLIANGSKKLMNSTKPKKCYLTEKVEQRHPFLHIVSQSTKNLGDNMYLGGNQSMTSIRPISTYCTHISG
jgi:hypothetical protein